MNVLFLKDWTNPETGTDYQKGIIHKMVNKRANQLVKQGICEKLPDDRSWRELYQEGYASVSPVIEEVETESDPLDIEDDDLGDALTRKGFFNR